VAGRVDISLQCRTLPSTYLVVGLCPPSFLLFAAVGGLRRQLRADWPAHCSTAARGAPGSQIQLR
jgi:hypothetical protein